MTRFDRPGRVLAGLAALSWLFLGGSAGSCRDPTRDPSPPEVNSEAVRDLETVREIKRRHDAELMALPGVVGSGIAADETGRHVIEVYVEEETSALKEKIPEWIESVPVRIVETGAFEARPDEGGRG